MAQGLRPKQAEKGLCPKEVTTMQAISTIIASHFSNDPGRLPPSVFSVNPHAVLRYRQRTGTTKGDEKVRNKIIKMFSESYEVELKQEYKAVALLNHGFVEARYFRFFDWILVFRSGEIVTIHEGGAKRWTRDTDLENKIKFDKAYGHLVSH